MHDGSVMEVWERLSTVCKETALVMFSRDVITSAIHGWRSLLLISPFKCGKIVAGYLFTVL
ncbi:hypothetical protein [Halobacteriovorax sp. ZH5_bin.2]|uniref:hypothetical protein n=1 Tax=Halobacteriovorax sp. ZH5_bin.2 TaxID=3157727 RepID=UPI00371C317B